MNQLPSISIQNNNSKQSKKNKKLLKQSHSNLSVSTNKDSLLVSHPLLIGIDIHSLCPFYSELVNNIYKRPLVVSILVPYKSQVSKVTDDNINDEIVKYRKKKLKILIVKVYDLVESKEAIYVVLIKDFLKLYDELVKECGTDNVKEYYQPLLLDWWMKSIKYILLTYDKPTITEDLSVIVDKAAIKRMVKYKLKHHNWMNEINTSQNITSTSDTNNSNENEQQQQLHISYQLVQVYADNTLIECNYKEKGKWIDGYISKFRSDGTYDIFYTNGEIEYRVEERLICLHQSPNKLVYSPKHITTIINETIKNTNETNNTIIINNNHIQQSSSVKEYNNILENTITTGSWIYGNYKRKGQWLPGIIHKMRKNGTFDIDYDEGIRELKVDPVLVRYRSNDNNSTKKKKKWTIDNTNNILKSAANIQPIGDDYNNEIIVELTSDSRDQIKTDGIIINYNEIPSIVKDMIDLIINNNNNNNNNNSYNNQEIHNEMIDVNTVNIEYLKDTVTVNNESLNDFNKTTQPITVALIENITKIATKLVINQLLPVSNNNDRSKEAFDYYHNVVIPDQSLEGLIVVEEDSLIHIDELIEEHIYVEGGVIEEVLINNFEVEDIIDECYNNNIIDECYNNNIILSNKEEENNDMNDHTKVISKLINVDKNEDIDENHMNESDGDTLFNNHHLSSKNKFTDTVMTESIIANAARKSILILNELINNNNNNELFPNEVINTEQQSNDDHMIDQQEYEITKIDNNNNENKGIILEQSILYPNSSMVELEHDKIYEELLEAFKPVLNDSEVIIKNYIKINVQKKKKKLLKLKNEKSQPIVIHNNNINENEQIKDLKKDNIKIKDVPKINRPSTTKQTKATKHHIIFNEYENISSLTRPSTTNSILEDLSLSINDEHPHMVSSSLPELSTSKYLKDNKNNNHKVDNNIDRKTKNDINNKLKSRPNSRSTTPIILSHSNNEDHKDKNNNNSIRTITPLRSITPKRFIKDKFIPTNVVLETADAIYSKSHSIPADRYKYQHSSDAEYHHQHGVPIIVSKQKIKKYKVIKPYNNDNQNNDITNTNQNNNSIDNINDNINQNNHNVNHNINYNIDKVVTKRAKSPFENKREYKGSRRRVLDIIEWARKQVGGSEKIQLRKISNIEKRLLESPLAKKLVIENSVVNISGLLSELELKKT